MSEKLYRIKPLVWDNEPGLGMLASASGHIGVEYRLAGTPKRGYVAAAYEYSDEDWWHVGEVGKGKTKAEAKAAAQRDYEQRLLSAGVLEEVERG